tara:strand:+ start:2871 stop:3791 length:921 start_codon:yes stop_codon:yes gene_type:complete
MNNIIILLGPTASGKSKISYLLANDFDFEIINADLFSIYKYLNIGTAKPSNEKFKTYKHYLFNKLEPNETYNVSSYCADVLNAIDNIIKRRKIPLIVGGSMMYVFQLLNGLTHTYHYSDGDLNLIKFIREKYTNLEIYNSIRSYNAKLIDNINVNDSYRIEKLLERLLSIEKSRKDHFNGLYNNNNLKITTLFVDIHDRKHLKENIQKRTQEMFNSGLIEEVETLKKKYNLTKKNQSMKAIGYKETLEYINKKISIDELQSKIIVSTQQLAKRQITWKKKFKINYTINHPKLDYLNLFKYLTESLK